MRAYFFSDIHIMSSEDPNLFAFAEALSSLVGKATHVFLLGDIFDLWVADHEYFAQKFSPVIQSIKKLLESDIEVFYVEGNHDFFLKGYWEKKLGVQVVENELEMDLGNIRLRVEHGDFINPDDKAYLRWRKFIRSKFMYFSTHKAPSSWVENVGEWLSSRSRKRTRSRGHSHEVSLEIGKKIEKYSIEKSKTSDFDLMVFGHVHVEKEFNFQSEDGRSIRSVNLGYWDRPKAYMVSETESKFVNF